MEIKKAEIAAAELVTLVHISDLMSKAMIEDVLKDFMSDAKQTSRGLMRFGSRVAGAVDRYVNLLRMLG